MAIVKILREGNVIGIIQNISELGRKSIKAERIAFYTDEIEELINKEVTCDDLLKLEFDIREADSSAAIKTKYYHNCKMIPLENEYKLITINRILLFEIGTITYEEIL
jgi:hypothetical protein